MTSNLQIERLNTLKQRDKLSDQERIEAQGLLDLLYRQGVPNEVLKEFISLAEENVELQQSGGPTPLTLSESDIQTRMSVDIHTERSRLSSYLHRAYEIRVQFREAANNYPEMFSLPDKVSINNIFELASKRIGEFWDRSGIWEKYKDELPEKKDFDAQYFKAKIDLRQEGRARDFYFMSAMSSERQLQVLALVNKWILELSEETCEQAGFTKAELKAYVQMSGVVGKYADVISLRQLEILDNSVARARTGESIPAAASPQNNEATQYYSYQTQGGETLSFEDVFKGDYQQMLESLEGLKRQFEKKLGAELDERRFKPMVTYIERFIQLLRQKNPDGIQMRKDLVKALADLINSDCPFVLIGPYEMYHNLDETTNPKADFGFRLGIKEKPEEGMGELLDNLRPAVARLNGEEYADQNLKAVVFLNQTTAHGPDLSWYTTGESVEGVAMITTNQINKDAGRVSERRAVIEGLPVDIDEAKLLQFIKMDTVCHEAGHCVVRDAVNIDELKAELMAVKFMLGEISRRSSTGDLSTESAQVDLEYYFYAKLMVSLDYIVNNDGAYSEAGEIIIKALENAGAITRDGEKITIVKERIIAGLQILDRMGDQLIEAYKQEDAEDRDRPVRDFINSLPK